tara:strand:+ start:2685 stop:4079 length:1395 start_codon:yes stop_codon:yes gene_type:complete
MPEGLINISYVIAGIFFILSLGGLSRQETAIRGNYFGIAGMILAVIATILSGKILNLEILIIIMLLAGIIGVIVGKRVEMTSMPELIAILHSFVGVAAVLVGIVSLTRSFSEISSEIITKEIEIVLGSFIGAYTFSGSLIAFLKLRGSIGGKPFLLPFRHGINFILLLICIILGISLVNGNVEFKLVYLSIIITLGVLVGIHMILAIGGADMPVVVSMLNSYSGWAASSAGFMLSNNLLIITGALVGSSGAILSYIMCRGMNRSFLSVISGGFGSEEGASPDESMLNIDHEIRSISIEETEEMLCSAQQLIIVPGYGMAVAQAQHIIKDISEKLLDKGIKVKFAIHPVAGRLPGHMNVLLAEANLPYDIVFEMDEINSQFKDSDVVLVVGANDIVNPGAMSDESSPIFGMPVLEVWESKNVIVLKRTMAAGYSGVSNPLYTNENTSMLFGDAKESLNKIALQIS